MNESKERAIFAYFLGCLEIKYYVHIGTSFHWVANRLFESAKLLTVCENETSIFRPLFSSIISEGPSFFKLLALFNREIFCKAFFNKSCLIRSLIGSSLELGILDRTLSHRLEDWLTHLLFLLFLFLVLRHLGLLNRIVHWLIHWLSERSLWCLTANIDLDHWVCFRVCLSHIFAYLTQIVVIAIKAVESGSRNRINATSSTFKPFMNNRRCFWIKTLLVYQSLEGYWGVSLDFFMDYSKHFVHELWLKKSSSIALFTWLVVLV